MTLKIVKPETKAELATRTTHDTIEVTKELVESWLRPPFQRTLKITPKVLEVAAAIKGSQIIPGTLSIGILDRTKRYLYDGQHRVAAYLESGLPSAYAEARFTFFDDFAEMGDEYVRLNQHLVAMKPDDILKGLEQTYEPLAKLRRSCPFVGYDNIRRNDKSPVLGMSQTIRCWVGSAGETPSGAGGAATLARELSVDDVEVLARFLDCAFVAWGKDAANHRLWGSLNLTICMWLFRRLVIAPYSAQTQKLDRDLFVKCLMSVSSAELYVDWLLGRNLKPRDLTPAYSKIKGLFATRIETETGKKPRLPQPAWATSAPGSR